MSEELDTRRARDRELRRALVEGGLMEHTLDSAVVHARLLDLIASNSHPKSVRKTLRNSVQPRRRQ